MSDRTRSAGILLFRGESEENLTVLVAHPGGPFFKNKDNGWWSIPKGEPEDGEEMFDAAVREFKEETGLKTNGPYLDLGTIFQKNGKKVFAWACPGNWPEGKVPQCNEITLEYPKGSGKEWKFPEIDQAKMVTIKEAKEKLREDQHPFLNRLLEKLKSYTQG